LVLSLFTSGCSSTYKIQTEEIQELDFQEINSFKFYNPNKESEANFSFNEADKKTLYDATSKELKNLGLGSIQEADVIVRIQGGVTVEVINSNYYNNTNYYYQQYDYWNNPNYYNDRERDQSKKNIVLIINFIEPGTNKLMWQGTATGKMGKNIEDHNLKLEEAVHLIFQKLQTESGTQ
jgi:hypothetical protein